MAIGVVLLGIIVVVGLLVVWIIHAK